LLSAFIAGLFLRFLSGLAFVPSFISGFLPWLGQGTRRILFGMRLVVLSLLRMVFPSRCAHCVQIGKGGGFAFVCTCLLSRFRCPFSSPVPSHLDTRFLKLPDDARRGDFRWVRLHLPALRFFAW
jgi:hypothetical protein